MANLITIADALEIVLAYAHEGKTERVKLNKALHRVLAQQVVSDIDMPPFDKSSMDGYAMLLSDMGKVLTVQEVIPAGKVPTLCISPGHCSKIMTGAQVPLGADCVVMLEDTEQVDSSHIRCLREFSKSNITPQGEDCMATDVVCEQGALLKPQHIAVLASVGCTRPLCYKHPSVGIVATGSELTPPAAKPVGSQIRNSNGPQLIAQVAAMGIAATDYGIAADDQTSLQALLSRAFAEQDVLLISGGVSAGDYDFVPETLTKLGFTIHFNGVSVQPGKPLLFATNGKGKYCFGMPGNPVSCFVQFLLFVKPFLQHSMGYRAMPLVLKLPMAGYVHFRKPLSRTQFVPASIENNTVEFSNYNGSAHIGAYVQANAIVEIPVGTTELNQGDYVHVRLL